MAYPNNTARGVFAFTMPNGAAGYVTPHFRTFGGADFTQSDVEDLADLLADWWSNADFEGETNTALRNIAPDSLTLSTITVTSLDPTTPPQHILPVAEAGLETSAPLPNESALVVTLYTGLVGRRNRGRNFWPVLATDYMQANGTIQDATLATIQDTFSALVAGLVNDGRFVLAVNSTAGAMVNQVTSVLARDTVHHQRRRNS